MQAFTPMAVKLAISQLLSARTVTATTCQNDRFPECIVEFLRAGLLLPARFHARVPPVLRQRQGQV
jgi:hypothetical protein